MSLVVVVRPRSTIERSPIARLNNRDALSITNSHIPKTLPLVSRPLAHALRMTSSMLSCYEPADACFQLDRMRLPATWPELRYVTTPAVPDRCAEPIDPAF